MTATDNERTAKENEETDEVETVKETVEEESEVKAESDSAPEPAPASESSTSLGTFEATAYTAQCNGCSGITATGVDVRSTTQHNGRTVVAVDPSVIALGTELIVTTADGREIEAIASDTGGAIKGNRIDILFANHSDAVNFGRQNVEVRKVGE